MNAHHNKAFVAQKWLIKSVPELTYKFSNTFSHSTTIFFSFSFPSCAEPSSKLHENMLGNCKTRSYAGYSSPSGAAVFAIQGQNVYEASKNINAYWVICNVTGKFFSFFFYIKRNFVTKFCDYVKAICD